MLGVTVRPVLLREYWALVRVGLGMAGAMVREAWLEVYCLAGAMVSVDCLATVTTVRLVNQRENPTERTMVL